MDDKRHDIEKVYDAARLRVEKARATLDAARTEAIDAEQDFAEAQRALGQLWMSPAKLTR